MKKDIKRKILLNFIPFMPLWNMFSFWMALNKSKTKKKLVVGKWIGKLFIIGIVLQIVFIAIGMINNYYLRETILLLLSNFLIVSLGIVFILLKDKLDDQEEGDS